MTAITDRIAEVLAWHEYGFGIDTNCSCGARGIWTWADYQPHVAEVLAAELGLPDPRPGLLAAADVLDGYLTVHPETADGRDIYHLLQELRYMADNADEAAE